jgi:transcriptional regulator with XRE-family HTH domain
MTRHELGLFLKERRTAKRILLKDIAKVLGHTASNYALDIENGAIRHPRHSTMKKISAAYKIPLHILQDVFYPPAEIKEAEATANKALNELLKEKIFDVPSIRPLRSFALPHEVKLAIIAMAEKITGKKYL